MAHFGQEINDLNIYTKNEHAKVESDIPHQKNLKKASKHKVEKLSTNHRKKKHQKKIKKHSKKRRTKTIKKKKANREDPEPSNSDSTDSSSEEEWVEKESMKKEEPVMNIELKETKPNIRDEWMTLPSILSCGPAKNRLWNDEREQKKDNVLDSLGQHERELNPYWKNGGNGLPTKSIAASDTTGTDVKDCSKMKATIEGRSLEDAAIKTFTGSAAIKAISAKWLLKMASLAKCKGAKRKLNFVEDAHGIQSEGQIGYLLGGELSRLKKERQEHALLNSDLGTPAAQSRKQDKHFNSKDKASSTSSKSFQKPNFDVEDNNEKDADYDYKSFSLKSEEERNVTLGKKVPIETKEVLSDKEMNVLGAKLIKAELMGDTEKAAELQKSIEHARALRSISQVDKKLEPSSLDLAREETVILTKTEAWGCVQPLIQSEPLEPSGGRRRKPKANTHAEGNRVRYFADDDKHSLQDMFVREKLNIAEDENEIFSKVNPKKLRQGDSEYDIDDMFIDNAGYRESSGKMQSKERHKLITEYNKNEETLNNCQWCLRGKNRMVHLVVKMGNKAMLCVPPYQSLTIGHCLIIPIQHVACSTQLDEDVWDEIQSFQRGVISLFSKRNKEVIFFETVKYLKNCPHLEIQCVPMPKEIGEMAPIYFKKAILECEMEWSTNKKLVDLSQSDVRRAIPKGLPYFAVNFGTQGGFAHVIEDHQLFPKNFAQEIIGGMLKLDPVFWRKPCWEKFEKQRDKGLDLQWRWKQHHHDFTPDAD